MLLYEIIIILLNYIIIAWLLAPFIDRLYTSVQFMNGIDTSVPFMNRTHLRLGQNKPKVIYTIGLSRNAHDIQYTTSSNRKGRD